MGSRETIINFITRIFTNFFPIYFQLVSTSEGNQRNRGPLNRRTTIFHLPLGTQPLGPVHLRPTTRDLHPVPANRHTSQARPISHLNSPTKQATSPVFLHNQLINHHSRPTNRLNLPTLLAHQLLVTSQVHLHHPTSLLNQNSNLQATHLLLVTNLRSHPNLATIIRSQVTNRASLIKPRNQSTCPLKLVASTLVPVPFLLLVQALVLAVLAAQSLRPHKLKYRLTMKTATLLTFMKSPSTAAKK